jgi:hypothetical protein
MSQSSSHNELEFESNENLDTNTSSENITSAPAYLEEDKIIQFFDNNPSKDNIKGTSSKSLTNKNNSTSNANEGRCPRCGSNPQFLARSSNNVDANIFGRSVKLDQEILNSLGVILSNKSLRKSNEAEYFDDMNIFDQEWEFPFNKRHFEYEQLVDTIESNPMELKVDMYKRTLIDLQIQLRDLSDYFIKVDKERLFFRKTLVSVLQTKLKEITEISPKLKDILNKNNGLGSNDEQIQKLKKENKESQSLFVNLKRRNVKLEEEVKKLKKKLKEKRNQLKKYMFRKETGEDQSITRASNSGINQISGERSKEGLANFKPSLKSGGDLMKKKLKFSSTILTNRQGKEVSSDKFPQKNKSTLQRHKTDRSNRNSNPKTNEYFQNNQVQKFLQDSSNNFQKAFMNSNLGRGSRVAERPSILTESGQVEIPGMLLNLPSQRKSRLSGFQSNKVEGESSGQRRQSGFKMMNEHALKKSKGKLSSKLLQIKKRNSKFVNQQNNKNPFIINKVNFIKKIISNKSRNQMRQQAQIKINNSKCIYSFLSSFS